ncbi:hypothetical protein [Geoglobus acetivorans]|uniref:hypothetical protein n=1 Tax=Geoglobus acetivorans TaxID=565033 RepID=UPI00064E4572
MDKVRAIEGVNWIRHCSDGSIIISCRQDVVEKVKACFKDCEFFVMQIPRGNALVEVRRRCS